MRPNPSSEESDAAMRVGRTRVEELYAWYERLVPAFARRLLRPLIDSPTSLRQLVVYIAIGIVTVVVDFGTLALLLRTRLYLGVDVTIAYATAASVQFMLNRNHNFRNFDRPIAHQARTTVAIAVVVWVFTVVWVEVLVRWLGLPALVAKALSIPITVVIGFVSFRFLIFGPGFKRGIKTWLSRP